MNGYEIQITGTLFIQATNQDDCEKYLKETILDAGLFNVVASAKQTTTLSEYLSKNHVYENYEVDWSNQ